MKASSTSRFSFLCRFAAKKLLFCLLVTAASSSGSETPARRHIQIRYMMGTLCEITAYPTDQDKDNPDIAINAAFDELKRIDSLLSNWNPNSELMRMNAVASRPGIGGVRPAVKVSPELFERIGIALDVARASQGLFDPTVGPLVRAWGFLPSPARPENRAGAVAAARTVVGWEKVRLDAVQHTVQFAAPGMEIDLGGIAKGYATRKGAQVLRGHGIQSGLVSLGSSSMTAIGVPPGATGWHVFIRDPRDGESPAAWIDLRDGDSLATSGTYEKTVLAGKTRRSHIIDPRTGEAIGGTVSVTVLLEDAEIADALTKPFFMSPSRSAEDWAKWLARFPKASIILMTAQGDTLKWIRAGADAERFVTLPLETGKTHVAKTN
jgi:thiamine biosynthesis lipoprotein